MDKELFDVKEMNNLVEICLEVDSHWQIDMYIYYKLVVYVFHYINSKHISTVGN